MRRLFAIAAAFVVCVLPLGAAEHSTRATQAGADGYPAAGAPPIVTLISAGAAPRMPLRYSMRAGQKTSIAVTTDMGMSMEMAGMAMPEMKMPSMKMVVDMAVTSVAANGDMSFDSSIASMTIDTSKADPMLAGAMQGATPDMSGMKASGILTNRGLSTAKFSLDSIKDPQMKQMLDSASSSIESISMPMPEEPVGVGAKWEVRQHSSANGISVMMKQTVELTAVQGSKITLKITMDQTAPPQAIKNPALPPEAEINLSTFSGKGTSTSMIDLSTMAVEGEGSASMAMAMNMKMQGMEQVMSMTTTLKLKMAPVK